MILNRYIELTLEALAEYNIANTVQVVIDGAEALDYLFREGKFSDRPEGNPVVIFLDLKLPNVDGLEVLRNIRADDRLKLIRELGLFWVMINEPPPGSLRV